MYGAYPPPAVGVAPVAQLTPQQELESLQTRAQVMEEELGNIRQRITQLESEAKKE
jgi:hypothetical protein